MINKLLQRTSIVLSGYVYWNYSFTAYVSDWRISQLAIQSIIFPHDLNCHSVHTHSSFPLLPSSSSSNFCAPRHCSFFSPNINRCGQYCNTEVGCRRRQAVLLLSSGDFCDPGLLLPAVWVRALGAAHEQLRAGPRSVGEVTRHNVRHGVDEDRVVVGRRAAGNHLGAHLVAHVLYAGCQARLNKCMQTLTNLVFTEAF